MTGARPVATSSSSEVMACAFPSASSTVMVTSLSVAVAPVTLVPVCTAMPCFLKDFSSSAEMASSSLGTRRGSSSTIVTSLPKRW